MDVINRIGLCIACSCALIIAPIIAVPVLAQSISDEIVVTGTRLDRYSDDELPNVFLEKRADFVVLEIDVENDTRQPVERYKELEKTVLALTKAAKKRANIDLTIFRTIEVGYDEITINSDFTMDSLEDDVTLGSRSDTSRVTLALKTPLLPSDKKLKDPYERLQSFHEGVATSGRTTITDDGEASLSIKTVERYREELIEAIVTDINRHRALLPRTDEVDLSGLEKPLRWERADELTLRVYVPYTTVYGLNLEIEEQ